MSKNWIQPHPRLLLALLMAITTALVWAPFILNNQVDILYRYWDGPSYVTVAYGLYSLTSPIYAIYGFGPAFYAAHLPAYPIVIRLLSFIGYFPGMLLSTLIFAMASVLIFYELAQQYASFETAFGLSALFTVIPARWLIYHAVGASEPLFITALLACLYFFHKRQYLASAAMGIVAVLTRVNGLLILPALLAALWIERRKDFTVKNVATLLSIGFFALAWFTFYYLNFGDFFAAFSVNQQNVNGLFSAIAQFGGAQAGELTVILFGLYLVGTARLWQQKRILLALTSAFLVLPLLFYAHNDISRYMLPAAPLSLLLAWDDALANLLKSKTFWAAIVIFAAAGYAYAWNVLPQNLMPAEPFSRLIEFVH